MSSDVVQESISRLSSICRLHRKEMAENFGSLQADVNQAINVAASINDLRTSLAAAKKADDEQSAEKENTSDVHRMRLELALANDEVTRRGAQIRSLELRLKAVDCNDHLLAAAEAELQQHVKTHEATVMQLGRQLDSERAESSRLRQQLEAEHGPSRRAQVDSLQDDLARERNRTATVSTRVVALETELEALRREAARWRASAEDAESALASERSSLKAEKEARRRLESSKPSVGATKALSHDPAPPADGRAASVDPRVDEAAPTTAATTTTIAGARAVPAPEPPTTLQQLASLPKAAARDEGSSSAPDDPRAPSPMPSVGSHSDVSSEARPPSHRQSAGDVAGAANTRKSRAVKNAGAMLRKLSFGKRSSKAKAKEARGEDDDSSESRANEEE